MSNANKILIVDDSRSARAAIKHELKPGNYNILEAGGGKEAISILEVEKGVKLIILDIEMPGLNGFDTCKLIKKNKKLKHIHIIFLTGRDSIDCRLKGYHAGATDFIDKSFQETKLLFSVKKLLEPDMRYIGMSALIIEVDPTSKNLLESILSHLGLSYFIAADGKDAFDYINKGAYKPDLIISHIHEKDTQGVDFCKKIRNVLSWEDIPIIVTSDKMNHNNLLNLYKYGISDHILKPYIKEEVLAKLKVHLENRLQINKHREIFINLKESENARAEFLSICSHDLRSPLNGILGYAELIAEDATLSREDINLFSNKIVSCGTQLLEFINDLLELSRLEFKKSKDDLSRIPLEPLIKQSFEFFTPTLNRDQVLLTFTNLIDSNTAIFGEENSLRKIFCNLLSNAIKFTPTKRKVEVTLRKNDNKIEISFKDQGIGIPESMLPTLFDRLSKSGRPGLRGELSSGLGLSIVKELVEILEGSIKVQSTEGEGSEFVLQFPEISNFDQKTVLIVDDQISYAEPLIYTLRKSGVDVEAIDNGPDALAYIEKKLPSLVILDFIMQPMDGIEVLQEIRCKHSQEDLPIIMLSSKEHDFDREMAMANGTNAYLSKSTSISQIEPIIHQLIKDKN